MRAFALLVALSAAGCATTPHAWQDAATGAPASAEEIMACQREADREAQRSVMMSGWGGVGYYPGWWGPGWWGPGRFAPGWSLGMAWSPGLAIAQRSQELMAFCMRLKGYAWAPVRPMAGAAPPAESGAPAPKP